MADVVVTRRITASPERAWEVVADLPRWADMLPTVNAIERVDTGGPLGVGARFAVRQPGLPKLEYQVTEWTPGRSFTWVAKSIGVATIGRHAIEATDEGCELTLSIEWAGPVAGVIRLLYGKKTAGMVNAEGDTFARLAETS